MPGWFEQNAPRATRSTSSAVSGGGGWFALNAPNRRPVSAEDFIEDDAAQGSAVGRFLSGAGEMLNPVTMIKGMAHAVVHPIDTTKALVGAQRAEFDKARQLYGEGRYQEAAAHGIAGALPVLGPVAASVGEQIAEGDIAGGLGRGVGLAAPVVIGATLPKSARVPAILKNKAPIAAEAVELAQKAGVPIDAGLATGNRFVKALQHVSDRSLGGSLVAGKAAEAQAKGLASLGEQLAAKGYASPLGAEQAGESLRAAITGRVKKFSGDADTAYDQLRKFEAHPIHQRSVQSGTKTVGSQIQTGVIDSGGRPVVRTEMTEVPVYKKLPLPVDLEQARVALRPIYDDLSRQAELAPSSIMGDKARALSALDKLMTGERYAPISTVDAVLGDLKSFARADEPALRTMGQGAAAEAVKSLDAAVQKTAAQAGSQVLKALKEGRAATVEKYKAADVLNALHDEPVRTITKLTADKDANVGLLRDVAQHAPAEMPKIGRAVLDNMLTQATAEGGFGHGAALAAKWDRLGTATKHLVFRDPAYVHELDRFFRLGKMAAENPNPSGTAHTLLTAGQGGLILTNPLAGVSLQLGTAALSGLLHSKAGVKLLTRGMRIPIGDKAAAAAWITELGNAGLKVPTSPSGSQSPSLVPVR